VIRDFKDLPPDSLVRRSCHIALALAMGTDEPLANLGNVRNDDAALIERVSA
jgi:hypothetical protein